MVGITVATWVFVFFNFGFIFSECIGYGLSLLAMPPVLLFMSICNRFSKHKAEDKTIVLIYIISIMSLVICTAVVVYRMGSH
jgi:hypothetical protein